MYHSVIMRKEARQGVKPTETRRKEEADLPMKGLNIIKLGKVGRWTGKSTGGQTDKTIFAEEEGDQYQNVDAIIIQNLQKVHSF